MKHLSKLLLISTLVLSGLHAQDNQWYVHKGEIKNDQGIWVQFNSTTPPIDLKNFFILNEPHPNTSLTPPGRNDFLIIYKDASGKTDYINSRYSSTFDNSSYQGSGYHLQSITNVEYLYLTNAYEEDHPPAYISSSGAGDEHDLIAGSPNSHKLNNLISFSHDIVKNRDLTVILHKDNIEEICGEANSYTLCFDKLVGQPEFSLSDAGVSILPSEIFAGNTAVLNMSDRPIQNNCIEDFNLDSYEKYAFLNLHIPQEIEQYNDNRLIFSLVNKDSSCLHAETDTIIDSHDPNFIKVLCVSEENSQKYAKYRIQCLNDGGAAVGNLILYVAPPSAAIANPIIKGWKIGVEETDYTQSSLDRLNSGSSGGFWSFDFSGIRGLASGATAWVDICVKLNNGFELSEGLLQPPSAHTSFDGTEYAITDFIDPGESEKMRPKGEPKPNIGEEPNLTREVASSCKCSKQTIFKWWKYAIALGAVILILGLVFSKSKRG